MEVRYENSSRKVRGAFIQTSWNLMHEYISRLSTTDFKENQVRTHLTTIFLQHVLSHKIELL